jgi:Tol biopolymer transport system component
MKLSYALIPLGLALYATPLLAQDYAAVSETTAGGLPNDGIADLAMSGDGRYVVFSSPSTDMVSGDTNGNWDIFLRDTTLDTTEMISMASSGALANSDSRYPEVTEDGRYVVFQSAASNLVAGDVNGATDTFLVDRTLGTVTLVSVSTLGVQQNLGGYAPRGCDVSDDGRYVAWMTLATNLSPYDTYGWGDRDVYYRDLVSGTTSLVSIAYLGDQRDTGWEPSVSADGSRVSFTSSSWLIHPDDSDSNDDVFVWHSSTGYLEIASQTAAGLGGTGGNSSRSRITPDGRYVVFESSCTDLHADDTTTSQDIYLRDRTAGVTDLVSYNADGSVYSGYYSSSYPGCTEAAVSADGRYVSFYAGRWMTDCEATGAYLRDRTDSLTELIGIPRWWWPSVSGDGWEPQVTDDGRKVLLRDNKGTPEHGTWGRHVASFRLRDTSKNTVHMHHPSAVWWGSSIYISACNAEADAPYAILRSFARTGFSYGGASFDLGPKYKVVHRGKIDADGDAYWSSPPIPQSAAGLTLYLEMAVFNSDGSISDSNFTKLEIVG